MSLLTEVTGRGGGGWGKAWWARCSLLNHMPEGMAQRHTLFKGVIQSVTLDAESFVTQ